MTQYSVPGHSDSHERGGDQELSKFFEEYDTSNESVQTLLSSLQSQITALTMALGALGHGIKAPGFLTATAVSLTPGTLKDVVSFSWTSSGGIIIVAGFVQITEIKTVNSDFIHEIAVARGGVVVGLAPELSARAPNNNVPVGSLAVFAVDLPAAGTYTYSVQATYANISTSGTPTANGGLLVVELSP